MQRPGSAKDFPGTAPESGSHRMTYKQRMTDCEPRMLDQKLRVSKPVVAGSIPAAPTNPPIQSLTSANPKFPSSGSRVGLRSSRGLKPHDAGDGVSLPDFPNPIEHAAVVLEAFGGNIAEAAALARDNQDFAQTPKDYRYWLSVEAALTPEVVCLAN
jgi:hypothetical protein